MTAKDYVVIPKSVLEDRIKEFEALTNNKDYAEGSIYTCKMILSKSKPILQIIEDAFDAGGLDKAYYLNKDI